ncbi:MAG: UvrY/SirA/GacA family response regulator transcription factor [Pseudomonadales bacterium]|nr:UvrY/SirA/GacA family response regulator transcription factor [Pseudomonadales bacterium]MBO6564782.1 UvrY/SirA/GacA family response regulator transcription factor [Pseudomonadales bacterium]MBO6597021.1 UvrY/SirA/GacA family response regulator transcription factor [Pseudomonadales bacterium]MBO6657725.1 UvrY/SirA/GacA family response regulator transcription factor [Pseudomonadales bacterium]MBO6703663.1 UvrY/SirA/GacA family response regulator transcription factor [Pseudomonadales bacterium
MTTILIADDHDLVRTSISRMLTDVYGYEVVGEACSGEEAVKNARSMQPDIVLMDVKMPGYGGIEATRKILQSCENTRIIALTGVVEDLFAKQLMNAGASGYVTKGAGFEEIVTAIKSVQRGERYMSRAIAQKIALANFSGAADHESPFDKLSDRELQTTIMISRGERVQDIAETLSVSPKTVNSYRYRIFEKLGINTDVELALLAVKHNLLDGEPSD